MKNIMILFFLYAGYAMSMDPSSIPTMSENQRQRTQFAHYIQRDYKDRMKTEVTWIKILCGCGICCACSGASALWYGREVISFLCSLGVESSASISPLASRCFQAGVICGALACGLFGAACQGCKDYRKYKRIHDTAFDNVESLPHQKIHSN